MSLFDRLKQKKSAPSKTEAAVSSAKKDKVSASESTAAAAGKGTVSKAHAFTLVKPHVSEKAAKLSGRGIYVFDVPLAANKLEVRKAVEQLYKVNVINVRTIRGVGKPVSRAQIAGRRSSWKKALVELKKGQTINLVEGV